MSFSRQHHCHVLSGLLLVCSLGGGASAAGQQRRAGVSPQKTPAISASFVKVRGVGAIVSGYLAKPAGRSYLPAALLVPGMDNLTGTVLQAARDMAANGFVALAVDYDPDRVSRESDLVRSVAEEQLSLRLNTAVDWLARQRPLVDPQRISAIGWGGGSARVLKLGQQGEVRAGVMIEEAPCRGPQNLPAVAVARILVIIGGCAPEQGQDLTRNYEGASSTYQVRALEARVDSFPQPSNTSAGSDAAGQVWSEVYRFLEETAGDSGTIAREAPVASSSSVATIRDIMRVINSDEGVRGKLAGLLAASSSEDTHWEQARSHAAILVESCDWLLARRPPRGSLAGWRGRVADFRDATQTLLLAVEKQDLPAAQQALGRLPESCAACHLDHR